MISESDWKKFKEIKANALQSYCQRILCESKSIMDAGDKSSHEKYLMVYEHINSSNDQIAIVFDSHSRSRAPQQLKLIEKMGLVSKEDLSLLSDNI